MAGVQGMSRADLYYADCNEHQPGSCRGCGGGLAPRRQYYCASNECRDGFEENHFWGTARLAAIGRATVYRLALSEDYRGRLYHRPVGTVCARCEQFCVPEVNHIVPVNGDRRQFSCAHHLDNLEVLCHGCHVEETNRQRRDGEIGPRARLVESAR